MSAPVEVRILGDGDFAGSSAAIGSYTVEEYGSPISMTNLQAGVGSLGFDATEDTSFNGTALLAGQPFELNDPFAGKQRGIIDSLASRDDTALSVSGSGILLPLVAVRSIAPVYGTLGAALNYYFASVGITAPVTIDADIAAIAVALPSFTGEVWNHLKKLMAVHQFEIAEIAGTIIVRKLRLRTVDTTRYTSTRLSMGRDATYDTVEVYYYNNESVGMSQVYPNPETSILDRNIISVGAGETVTTNYPVNMWIEDIDQPEQTLTLPWDMTSTSSVYSVVDRDGTAVSVAEWQNAGGMLTLAMGEDGRSVDVTVRGMSTQDRGPYRIAASSADQEYQYSSLYIAASGIKFDRKMISSKTGADPANTPASDVLTIDEPVVSSIEQANTVLMAALLRSSGPVQQFEAEATHVNRRGQTGVQLSPTFSDFDALWAGGTFAQFNIVYAGKTFADFDEEQYALTADEFANQAFGGIGGARVVHRNCAYRIRSVSATNGSYSWTSEPDTLFSEFDDVNAGTFADFDATWAGKTFEQHSRMPLAA